MHDILKHHTAEDACIRYRYKITYTESGFIKAREYKKTQQKVKEGYEPTEKSSAALGRISHENSKVKEITKRSLTRSRDLLFGYVAQNYKDWHSFITLTFAENVTDITEANKKFKYWVSQMKRRYPYFKYIGVPEYQKRGAVHYHILTNLTCGIELEAKEVIKTYNSEKNRYFSIQYYDIQYWIYGFSTAFDLNMTDDNFNACKYMAKYMYKDIDNRLFGRNKILKSNNLEKPVEIYLKDNQKYNDALNYVKEKGYDIESFEYVPDAPYKTGVIINTVEKMNETDSQGFKALILSSETEERQNIDAPERTLVAPLHQPQSDKCNHHKEVNTEKNDGNYRSKRNYQTDSYRLSEKYKYKKVFG